jgi:hypothetical protein
MLFLQTRSRPWWTIVILLVALNQASLAPGAEQPEKRTVTVRVDPRIELISIVFRLAGNTEYSRGRVKTYLKDVEEHFGPVRTHELIEYAAGLRKKYGVSYDACMSMAVHLQADDDWKLRFPMEPRPDGLDGRWRDASAQEFVTRLNAFVRDSDFEEFTEEHQDLYETTQQRLLTLLENEVHLEWFDEFFGARPAAQFTVIPALVNGGNCYGPHVKTPEGKEEFYTILGVWMTDWLGRPKFDASVVGTIIHEFCHSYTNAIVDRHEEAFRPAGEAMFPHVADAMRRQAYGTWKTMMYESLVRASVVRYKTRFESRAAVLREVGRQNQRGFVWIEELAELLGEYEENRDKYPTLDAFSPQIVEFFNDYAKEFDAKKETPPPPQVVSMVPENGDQNVDSALSEIRVVFDRPMQADKWSMCSFDRESTPEVIGKPSYAKGSTTWIVKVKLRPDHEYRFSLNSKWFTGFRSEEGGVLQPVEVRFKTAPLSDAETL